jgi:hypothetical protein
MRWLNLFGANFRKAGTGRPPLSRTATMSYNVLFEKPVVVVHDYPVPFSRLLD